MFAAVLGLVIGVVIGGLGGGGGVLTVPVLVYLLGRTAQDATASSVLIVGVTAAVGVLARTRSGVLHWRVGLAFGAVGIPSAAVGTLLNDRVAEPVLLLSFAASTLLAAVAMLLGTRTAPTHPSGAPDGAVAVGSRPAVRTVSTGLAIVSSGAVIGFLTGFLGVGGGFLMVPALVIILRLPMTHAVGTSLLIITVNSAAALATRAGVAAFDWDLLVPFTGAAIAGGFVGKCVSDRVASATLSRAFAVLLLLVGALVGVETLLCP